LVGRPKKNGPSEPTFFFSDPSVNVQVQEKLLTKTVNVIMIEVLLSLPTLLGGLLFIALTTAAGMAVYYVTFRLHTTRRSEEALKEVRDATSNLFRVVG
jgi:hypothetical protein